MANGDVRLQSAAALLDGALPTLSQARHHVLSLDLSSFVYLA